MNTEKTRFGFVSREKNAGQSYKYGKYIEIMTQFKYFGKTATNQNCMHKKVNSGRHLRTACYHSIHNIFFFPDGYPLKKKV